MTDNADGPASGSTDPAQGRGSVTATDAPDPGRADAEQDLRATADAIRTDLVRLAELETEKQRLDPSDPRVDQVSDEAVELADRIQRETRIERELSRELR